MIQAMGKFIILEHSMDGEKLGNSGVSYAAANTTASVKGKVISVPYEMTEEYYKNNLGVNVAVDTLINVGDIVYFRSMSKIDKIGDKVIIAVEFSEIIGVERQ